MAYTVSFGTNTKRENSTSQGYTEVLSASCLLKESTDILRPTVSVAAQIAGDALLPCNYMYISAFGRYYWITGIQYVHGSWYVSGEVDVLASWKTAIGNTTAYVLRSSALSDPYIPDTYVPFENNPSVVHDTHAIGFNTTGTIVLTICGGQGNVPGYTGSETFWALSPADWSVLYSIFFTSNFWTDYDNFFTAFFQDLYNTIVNPSDYIAGARWVPVDYASIGGTSAPVYLGFTSTGLNGKLIDPGTPLLSDSHTFTWPEHPQRQATGFHWLNGNIASKRMLFLPGYGSVPIDGDPLINNNSCTVHWGIDCTGIIYYKVLAGGRYMNFASDISCPVGFSDQRADPVSMVTNLATAGISAAAGSGPGAISGVGNALSSMFPSVSIISTGGSRMTVGLSPNMIISSIFYKIPELATYDQIGKPLCDITLLSAGGYFVCDHSVSVSCAGTQEEIQKINSYLSGGFFYE